MGRLDPGFPDEDACPLAVALAYENERVVQGFMDQYAVSVREARRLFLETRKLLWALAAAQRRGIQFPGISEYLTVLDEMWQVFILFTSEYRQYCESRLGSYVDRLVSVGSAARKRTAPARQLIEFLRERLGEATVAKWFIEYPRAYAPDRLESLRIVQATRRRARRIVRARPASRPQVASASLTMFQRDLPSVREPASLRQVMSYRNARVLRSFMHKYAVSTGQARELFTETKKFLWLIALARHRRVPTPFVSDEILVLDEMWHAFVLSTRDYRAYCEKHYGYFIDHAPTTRQEEAAAIREYRVDPIAASERWRAHLREQLSFIYDSLGRGTVVKWYSTLAKQYTRQHLEELRVKRAGGSVARAERGER